MKKLYRPVGVKEMYLILNTGCRKYPERLPTQPIFYPVLNLEYAKEIAGKWNIKDINSGYAGYITEFNITKEYISKYETHIVGAPRHKELWVPAEMLSEFNSHILPTISISDAFYGEQYTGDIKEEIGAGGEKYIEQFIQLKKLKDFNPMDFSCMIQTRWKIITLNYIAWMNYDFSNTIDNIEKRSLLDSIKKILIESKKWFFTF